MQLKSVVLPEPLGPIKPKIIPLSTDTSMSLFAARPPKNLNTCLISSRAIEVSHHRPGAWGQRAHVSSEKFSQKAENPIGHVEDDHYDQNPVDEHMRVSQVFLEEVAQARGLLDQPQYEESLGQQIGAKHLRKRHQHERAYHRSQDGADSADDADQHHLYRGIQAEDPRRVDEADVEAVKDAAQRGEQGGDRQRRIFVKRKVDTQRMSGVLVLSDRLEVVAKLGVQHEVIHQQGAQRQGKPKVIERRLRQPVGNQRLAKLQRRDVDEQNALGAVGELFPVEI